MTFEHDYSAKKFSNFRWPSSEPKARTRWNGWCVPSALAQFVWVWNNQYYNGVYLPNVDEQGFEEFGEHNRVVLEAISGNTGQYNFIDFASSDLNVDKNAIEKRSNAIDNGLYYSIIDNTPGAWNNFDGGLIARDVVKHNISRLTGGKVSYKKISASNNIYYIMHMHIKHEKMPILDSIDTGSEGHTRLLIGTKYYWHERYTWWTTGYNKAVWKRKWGWLWKTIKWETQVKTGSFGYKFLVWDNGFKMKHHNYQPYWEIDYAQPSRKKRVQIGLKN